MEGGRQVKDPKEKDDGGLLDLDTLTVLLYEAQEDPFEDIETRVDLEGTLLVGPEEWLED